MQLANLTARNLATLVHTPSKKKVPTGNKIGRPKATEVIAKTNTKVDQFFQRKTPVINADRPMQSPEEEKKQSEPSVTVALPQQLFEKEKQEEQQAEESKQYGGHLRVQVIEETKAEVFLTAKLDDPELRREHTAINLRKSKKKELLTKKRYPGLNQDQSFIQAFKTSSNSQVRGKSKTSVLTRCRRPSQPASAWMTPNKHQGDDA